MKQCQTQLGRTVPKKKLFIMPYLSNLEVSLRRKLSLGIISNITKFLRGNKESPAYIYEVSAKHPLHL